VAVGGGGRVQAIGKHELLLELSVPVVLDVVVCPPWELRRDDRPPAISSCSASTLFVKVNISYIYIAIGRKWAPASHGSEEAADDPVLVPREVTVLYVGPKVVEPAQPAALAAPLQPYTART
jgi:hypothetical protein